MAIDTAANIVKGIGDKTSPANGSNGKESTPPPKPATETLPIDPNAGKEKYTVDGKEIYLTPEQARAYVQKGIAFEPRMDQLGRLQHETAAFLEMLATDPAKIIYNDRFGTPQEVLKKILGSTKISDEIKDTLGQWYYENVIVPEKMSPEQREAQEWKAKAQAHDQWLKQQEVARLQAENDARVSQALIVLKAQISEAMTDAGVPLDAKIAPQLAKRVAQAMQTAYSIGRVLTPKEAMAKVKAEIFEYQKSYYDVLDEDKLVEQLGKDNAEKVRKYYLKAVKEAEKDKSKKDLKPASKRDERKVMTPDEFHDYLQELKKK